MTGGMVFLGTFILAGLSAAALLRPMGPSPSARRRIRQMTGPTPRPEKTVQPPSRLNSRLLRSLHYFLISAGLNVSPLTFLTVPGACGLAVALVAWFFTQRFAPALVLFALCLSLPGFYVLFKRRQLQQEIIREMHEGIGMIIRSLQVGQSVDGALGDAAAALSGPLGREIAIIYGEMSMGLSFEQAFSGFERRYPSLPDVKMFCTAFILQRETGGNLIQILDSLSDTIRKRFTFRRQVKTHTAEARISALIISLLPLFFAGAAFLMNPDYLSKLTGTPLGNILIWVAVGLEAAGFFVMRRMTKVSI